MKKSASSDKVSELILGRRSIRVYQPGTVSEQEITRLLEAAMSAPSAVARDPWRFVVVQDRRALEQLAPALSNGEMLLAAGTGIIVCGDLQAAHDGQLSYLLQDCSAAIENLLLAAHIEGLGACWMGVHPRETRIQRVKSTLGLPDTIVPVACVVLGQPGEKKEPRTRYRPEFVHWQKW